MDNEFRSIVINIFLIISLVEIYLFVKALIVLNHKKAIKLLNVISRFAIVTGVLGVVYRFNVDLATMNAIMSKFSQNFLFQDNTTLLYPIILGILTYLIGQLGIIVLIWVGKEA